MNFTKAIYFKDGKCLTITEDEAENIVAGLNAGGKWVDVQGEFISADNIARIGNHTSTTDIKKIKTSQSETEMKIAGKGDLIELKKADEEKKAIESALKEKKVMIGEPAYYIDENGEKIYS